jgi:hypothetical protein
MAETREMKSDEIRRLKDNVNGSRDWSMDIVLDNVDTLKSKGSTKAGGVHNLAEILLTRDVRGSRSDVDGYPR